MVGKYRRVFSTSFSLRDAIESFADFGMSFRFSRSCHSGTPPRYIQKIPNRVHKKLTSPESVTEDFYFLKVVCAPLKLAHAAKTTNGESK